MRALAVLVVALALGATAWFLLQGGNSPAPDPADRQPSTTSTEEPETSAPVGGALNVAGGDASPLPGVTGEAMRTTLRRLDLPQTPPPSGHGMIVGRVLSQPLDDAPPAPIDGARIEARAQASDGSVPEGADFEAIARPDGIWFLTLPAAAGYQLRFVAPRHEAQTLSIPGVAEGHLSQLGDQQLSRTVRVTVVVTSGLASLMEQEEPVADHPIVVRDGEETILAEGRTDEEGRLVIPDLPRRSLQFTGRKAPFGAISGERSPQVDDEELRFNVQPVGQVRVRAMSAAGVVLPSFRVALDIRRDNYGFMMPYFQDAEGDANGFHLIEGVKAGDYDLYATAEGQALGRAGPVQVAAGETTTVTVTLEAGHTIEGTVVSKGDGHPVAGATVFSEVDLIPATIDLSSPSEPGSQAICGVTDAAGRFRITGLTAGNHRLTAIHGDFTPTTRKGVVVGPGGTPPSELKIEMGPGATVEGHVYDQQGRPMAGTQVMAFPLQDLEGRKKGPQMTSTNEAGFYRIAHVPPGMFGILKLLTAPKSGENPFEMKMKVLQHGAKVVVDFGSAAEGATVTGQVTWADGSLGENLIVMVQQVSNPTGGIPTFFQGPTDGEGRYSIDGVPEGKWRVFVARVTKGSDFAGKELIEVPDGGRYVHDIRLEGASLSGVVRSEATGAGIDIGEVILLDEATNDFVGRITLDPGGRFHWTYLPAGRYRILARGEGHTDEVVAGVVVTAGDEQVLPPIKLRPGGRIFGTVRDEAGAPVSGATVRLESPEGAPMPGWSFPTTAEGTFEMRGIGPGTYRVIAMKEAARFGPAQAVVAPGAEVEVSLTPAQ